MGADSDFVLTGGVLATVRTLTLCVNRFYCIIFGRVEYFSFFLSLMTPFRMGAYGVRVYDHGVFYICF